MGPPVQLQDRTISPTDPLIAICVSVKVCVATLWLSCQMQKFSKFREVLLELNKILPLQ